MKRLRIQKALHGFHYESLYGQSVDVLRKSLQTLSDPLLANG
ncbi:MAG: hypothetical protein AAF926_08180 [Pseudomonadota bacterium]